MRTQTYPQKDLQIKHVLCLCNFKQNWNALRNVSEYPKFEIPSKYGHWELLW